MLPRALRALVRTVHTRRQAPRVPSSRLVDWREFGSAVHHVSQVGDLSERGAFVRAALPSPVGTPVVAEVGTSAGLRTVHARVAWVGPDGMGLRFTRPLDGG
jgi:hypothetical protein